MSSEAPIEIWHAILKYSISVPLFFDPDPVSTYGIDTIREYPYEAPYWDSERTRNSLRRVCCGWNHLLKGYNHRFIRLLDVVHGRVPITALPFAIRLDVSDSYYCRCKEICGAIKPWFVLNDILRTAFGTPCGEAVRKTAESDHWKLEIVKGWIPMNSSFYNDLKIRAPKVQAMISQSPLDDQIFMDLPPGLKLFLIQDSGYRPLFDLGKSSSLVTLRVTVQSLRSPVAKDNLPALRHLSIEIDGSSEVPAKEELYSFLKSIGPKLRTFYLRHSLSSISIDQCIWDLLPNAERVQVPHRWIGCKVPACHPLQAIQISIHALRFLGRDKSSWENAVVPHLPFSFESYRGVKIDTNWSKNFTSRYTLPLLMKIQDYYECLGIPLLDACGETLAQYILFLIKTFWKRRVKIFRKPQSDYILEHF